MSLHQCKTTSHYEARVKNKRLKTVNTNIKKWLVCTAEYGDMFHISVEQGKLWPFITFFTILICSGHIHLALHSHITPCFSCVNIIKLPIAIMHIYLPEYKHCSRISTGWHRMDGWYFLSAHHCYCENDSPCAIPAVPIATASMDRCLCFGCRSEEIKTFQKSREGGMERERAKKREWWRRGWK